jgi:lipopolysaccharide transport system permease protein
MSILNSLKEVWNRRSLILVFSISDLKTKYRNSILGYFWSILEPLFIFSVLYFVFTNVFKSQIEHYPLYLFLGIITWNMFSRVTSHSLTSILSKSNIITKIYIPREIFPISTSITSFLIMCFEFLVFIGFLIYFNFIPPTTIGLLPFILIPLFILSLGISLPLSIFNIYFRDIGYIWSVFIHGGFFAMPIIYQYNILPENIVSYLSLIPISKIILMSHDVVLYGIQPTFNDWLYLYGTSFAILFVGYFIFKKLEKRLIEFI